MPVLQKIDVIEGSSFSSTIDSSRYVRRAFVTGLQTSTPSFALMSALTTPGMPKQGDLHPHIINCRVTGFNLVGQSDDQAVVDIIYETPHRGLATLQWLVRDCTTMSQAITSKTARTVTVDKDTGIVKTGGNQVIEVHFDPAQAGVGDPGTSNKKPYKPEGQVFIPFRTVIAERLASSPLPEGYHDAAGMINADTWRGKSRGRWLFAGGESQQFGNGQYRQTLTWWLTNEWWYDLFYYRNEIQKIENIAQPTDFPGPPPSGGQVWRNGLTLASVYPEINFTDFFPQELASASGGYVVFNGTTPSASR